MHLDVAVDLLKKAEDSLCSYRHTGFVSAQISAKEICEEMNVVAVLKKKRLRTTKREFSYEAFDEPLTDTMKKLEVSFFNAVVDVAVSSLRERTEMMSNVASLKMTTLDLVFLEEKYLIEIYPNMWVALSIAVTTPVTVASAERSFSKLKLIKTYLRSTMSQERLNGLAIISINKEMSKQVSYEETLDAFAARKSRRISILLDDGLVLPPICVGAEILGKGISRQLEELQQQQPEILSMLCLSQRTLTKVRSSRK
ncbi:hypothetical protein Pmani_020151 [Petrolisthes manimaculis]|uniref:HAT C-terminal dimerisation domain-containing protein n=1 Tax=Petrolisthes manimaculis TaxID=1843537 RepID=A0AAE1U6N7_9EUCA|nr:hypothetical protein Pmani_020151 [Petrolisthes manimaculis]